MREGEYVDLVHKFIQTLPDDYERPHEALLAIGEQVAKKHPLWYASFWVRGWAVKGWRKVMGDARNVLKFLSEEQKRKRFNRAVEVGLSIVLVLVSAGLLWLALWLKTL